MSMMIVILIAVGAPTSVEPSFVAKMHKGFEATYGVNPAIASELGWGRCRILYSGIKTSPVRWKCSEGVCLPEKTQSLGELISEQSRIKPVASQPAIWFAWKDGAGETQIVLSGLLQRHEQEVIWRIKEGPTEWMAWKMNVVGDLGRIWLKAADMAYTLIYFGGPVEKPEEVLKKLKIIELY